jgi:hypothetical protein
LAPFFRTASLLCPSAFDDAALPAALLAAWAAFLAAADIVGGVVWQKAVLVEWRWRGVEDWAVGRMELCFQ